MKRRDIFGVFPAKVEFEDDTFELTTAAFGRDRTLTCNSRKILKDSTFKVVALDETGTYIEVQCVATNKDADKVTAKWN